MMPRVDVKDRPEAERFEALDAEAFHTRRDFLQRTAVMAGMTAAMGLALDPDTVVAAAARRQRRAALPSARNLPIDTFVVLMMENRSFDHYLGWLPGADGRQAGLHFTDTHGKTYATHRLANNYQGCAFLDPDHSWDGGRTELGGGHMNGFLKAASDVFSIGYYAEQDLPFIPSLAKEFTAFDRFFCSLLSSTYPNREFMHAGAVLRDQGQQPAGVLGRVSRYDDLRGAVEGRRLEPVLLHRPAGIGILGRPGAAALEPGADLLRAGGRGKLPALSFVDPSFNGESQGTSGDEHPHGDVRVGQAFISDVVHAFIESPQFERGALFLVYDEWGGFFDHVAPPRVPDLRASRTRRTTSGRWDSGSRRWSSPRTHGAATSTTPCTGSSRS